MHVSRYISSFIGGAPPDGCFYAFVFHSEDFLYWIITPRTGSTDMDMTLNVKAFPSWIYPGYQNN